MFRQSKYFGVLILLLTWSGSVSAQANSDYKTVAKKKIKSAIAYEVHEDGDTNFTRYNYDRNGYVTSFDTYTWNTWHYSERFDEQGRITGGLRLHPVGKTDTMMSRNEYVNLYGNVFLFDTAFYWHCEFNQNNDQVLWMSIDKENGSRMADLQRVSGDTTYYYSSRAPLDYILEEIQIKVKVDSIGSGYAEVGYRINGSDTTYDNCRITVLDRKGKPIRVYSVIKPDSSFIKRGMDFSPIGFAETKIRLDSKYEYEYTANGKLKATKQTDCETNETNVIPVIGGGKDKFESLEFIEDFGTVIYEYYEP